MKIVNLTPHDINLNGKILPSEGNARVATIPGEPFDPPGEGGFLYRATTYGEVEGLPEQKAGTIYVVSALVAARCVGRFDVFSPGTGPNDGAIRENGQIKGVTRLIQAPLV